MVVNNGEKNDIAKTADKEAALKLVTDGKLSLKLKWGKKKKKLVNLVRFKISLG